MELLGLGTEGRMFAGLTNMTSTGALINVSTTTAVGIRSLHRYTAFSLQFITRSLVGGFTGTWLVEASNNWCPDPGENGQVAYAGDWSDVTSLFTPTLTAAVSTATIQLVEPLTKPSGWRAIKVTITRTGGTSIIADVWICGKGH